jgi:NAD(P)-dependent dehydrogenase (short-subunit alcohol dehydrogenase family)
MGIISRRVPPEVAHVDMSGRLCVVTGASSGIGLETARGLVLRGADVVVVGRTPSRVDSAVDALRSLGGNVTGERVDFVSLEQTRALAARLLEDHPSIDVLVNNAGLWSPDRKESEEGHELTFAVNHLAPFLLTLELMPGLRRGQRARVVNVSSRLHRKAKHFDFDDVHQRNRRYASVRAYQQSKLANVLFTRELARRTEGVLCVSAVHPGGVATDVVRDNRLLAWGIKNVAKLWLLTPEEGARTSLYAATARELDQTSGCYFAACEERAPSSAALDPEQAKRLWSLSEELTGARL